MSERLNRCYAGWLGKLAGIRMGAPVEGWEYAKIKETYGELNGYIGDLSHFPGGNDRFQRPADLHPGHERFFHRSHFGGNRQNVAELHLLAARHVLVGRLRRVHGTHGLHEPGRGHSRPPKRQHRPERQNRGRADRRTDFHRSLGPGVPRPSRQGGGTGPAGRGSEPRRQRYLRARCLWRRPSPWLTTKRTLRP